jgi:uncharacterized protein with HEPN domain
MNKDPRVYLAQMLECIDRIERFTVDGKDRFTADAMVHDAVLRNLTVIGEAAKRVEDAYRAAHPEIAWRALAGLRDVVVHQYEAVDLDKVWDIVRRDLPSIRNAVAAILPPLERLERELAGEDLGTGEDDHG